MRTRLPSVAVCFALAVIAQILLLGVTAAYGQVRSIDPLPGDWYVTPAGINNFGQVVGISTHEEEGEAIFDPYTGDFLGYEMVTVERGFLWDNGTTTDLGDWLPVDINDSGQILCSHEYQGTGIWKNGTVTSVPLYDPKAISNTGEVVGRIGSTAYRWSIDGGSVSLGSYTRAVDINDNSGAAGYTTTSPNRAVVWQSNGVVAHPQTLGGSLNWARALNNSDQVVGRSYTDHDDTVAFIWELVGGSRELGTPPTSSGNCYSDALDINDQGKAVGHYYSDTPGEIGDHACMWQNNTMIDLDSMVPQRLTQAIAINDRGLILMADGYVFEPVTLPVMGDGVFHFENGDSGDWFDPPLAEGFRYVMTSGSLFTRIADFPLGFDSPFTITAESQNLGTFGPGESVDFVALLGYGVSEFLLSGISPAVDAEDPTALPLKLEFNTSTASFDMIPIPEPATLGLLAVGAVAMMRRRRR